MPSVSVIIPCYNEEKTIPLLLAALVEQTYPCSELEVIIADGLSSDGTRAAVAAFQAGHPDLSIRVVDNTRRVIPSGLNRALEAASGELIVRLDGHSVPRPDYVERCAAALRAGAGTLVGGVWEIQPGGPGWLARAIARTAAHPLAVGDALYRYARQASEVDTVPFGAYRRELIDQIGPYDETLLTNEDYEFAARVRQAGGRVWLDPAIRSAYFSRASLGALARQYWRYGFWKVRMLRRYARTLRWRQALPPLFVASLAGLALLGLAWEPARWLLLLELSLYAFVLIAAGLHSAVKHRDPALVIGLPLGIATMHLSWGAGFLWSLLQRDA